MASIVVAGDTSGSVTIAAPAIAGTPTLTLPTTSGTILTDNTAFTGQVAFFAMNTAPTGWIKANGANVSRTTYAALFAVIGTTFGSGDGSTTFTLPDLRGEFARGWDDGRGVDSGRAFGSAQTDDLKSHTHTTNAGSDTAGSAPRNRVAMGANAIITGPTIDATGGAETRPRNIALLACIKF